MTTIKISEPAGYARFVEMEKFVGAEKLFRKGTDMCWYANYRNLADAQLAVANLKANQFNAEVMSCPNFSKTN